MGPVADDVFERLLRQRAVFLRGALDGTNADSAIAQMLHLDGQEPPLEITLYVNCPRADLRSALAVYDMIQTVRPAVRTVCLGTAAGGAALVLAGGAEGERTALPNARITLYEPRRELRGTVGELDVQARELLRLRQQVHELLARHTGRPLERIQRDAEQEVWLNAAEAQAYGLIDEILPPGKADQGPGLRSS